MVKQQGIRSGGGIQMINWAHIHLVLTHIPVIGVAVIIAFLVAGKVRGSRELQWVSLQMFVALALLSIAVYLTGSPASHQMREKQGISREVIHRHSSAADFAFWSLEILGALSLGVLAKFRKESVIPALHTTVLLAVSILVFGLMIWTANLGGKIRHPEIGMHSSREELPSA